MRIPLILCPFKIVGLFLLFPLSLYSIEIHTLSQAIDVAGKQRMYTQRMLKDYAMIGLENHFGNPQKDIVETIDNFENHLNALIIFNSEEKTEDRLLVVKKTWDRVKPLLEQAPQKNRATKMQEDLETLLKQSNTAVIFFAKQTHKESGEIINISGRQRMLSQRMASLYMFKVWGINDPQFQKKMQDAMRLFSKTHKRLQKSTMNTDEIETLLVKVGKYFKFFEIMNQSSTKFIPALIYKKSNEILRDMNTVTGLYAKQEK